MDSLYSLCLRENRDYILEDLNPKYILSLLLNQQAITTNEVQLVSKEDSTKKQAMQLLEILMSKGKREFNCFIDCLCEDGNYPWLAEKLEKWIASNKAIQDEKQNMFRTLQRGGVPSQVKNHVKRMEMTEKVQKALREIAQQQQGWVVIHGMTGSGKTVLAVEALRDGLLLKEYFPGGVWWTSVGSVAEESALLIKMQILCDRIESAQQNSEIGQHSLPLNLDMAVRRIERALLKNHEKALIILDDVKSDKIINKFNFGGHVMITTQDIGVMRYIDEGNYKSVQLDSGLSLIEGKELLSQYVKANADELPDEVDQIYSRCRGSPLVLAVIGGSMENYRNDTDRWKHYNSILGKGQLNRIRRPSGQAEINDAIRLSLEQLTENLYQCFMSLVVFIEDVDIPNSVLEIFWGKDKFDVEDIMQSLFQKSLLCKAERQIEGKGFVYGIHDILLRYLKNETKDEDQQALHSKLVNNYIEKCRQGDTINYELLPDDGYIYYYLGYHLNKSKQHDLFPEIFLDLEFVERKVKLCGPSDLIYDYDIYGEHFRAHDSKRTDFLQFLRENANSLCDPEVDVIQVALCQPKDSEVYRQALLIAQKNPDPKKLYFNWCNGSGRRDCVRLSMKLHVGSVTCAVFSPANGLVASVGEDKIVKVWDSSSGRKFLELYGHQKKINCCVFSPDAKQLATASDDGTVRIWDLNYDVIAALREKGSRPRSGSSEKLAAELADDVDHSKLKFCEHQAEVLCCSFSNSGSKVVSADEEGRTLIWNKDSGEILSELCVEGQNGPITTCCFSPDDKVVVTSSSNFMAILWDAETGKIINHLQHPKERVSSCCFSKTHMTYFLISASGHELCQWNPKDGKCLHKLTPSVDTYVTCCAISPDGKFVATGSTDRSVCIWSLVSYQIKRILKGHGDTLMSVAFNRDGTLLLSASQDGGVLIWDMKAGFGESTVSLKTNFAVHFLGNDDLIVAAFDEYKQLQIFKGLNGQNTYKSDPEESGITACCIAPDGQTVFYGLSNGTLKSYNMNTDETNEVAKVHDDSITHCSLTADGSAVISCSDDRTLNAYFLSTMTSKKFQGHTDDIVCFKLFDEDRKILSGSKDGSLKVWLTSTGDCILSIDAHGTETVTSCDVSADNQYFASVSTDKHAKVWHANDGSLMHSVNIGECLRSCRFFSSCDKLAIGDDEGFIWLWDIINQTTPMQRSDKHNQWVKDIKISEDGSQMVSVGDTIKWWDPNGDLLQTFVIAGSLCHIYASPDFKTFTSIDENGVLYILRKVE